MILACGSWEIDDVIHEDNLKQVDRSIWLKGVVLKLRSIPLTGVAGLDVVGHVLPHGGPPEFGMDAGQGDVSTEMSSNRTIVVLMQDFLDVRFGKTIFELIVSIEVAKSTILSGEPPGLLTDAFSFT